MMKKLYLIISSLVIFSLSTDVVRSQNRSSRDKKSMLRQYTFAAFSVAESNSDSVRILSYIVVPNKVLKFVKKSASFESAYQAKVTLKNKKGEQVGRKSWSNTLKTDDYLESQYQTKYPQFTFMNLGFPLIITSSHQSYLIEIQMRVALLIEILIIKTNILIFIFLNPF